MTTLIISSGTISRGLSVLSGDALIVARAGSAVSTTVMDGGQIQVLGGGAITSSTISGDAGIEEHANSIIISSGGSALHTTVFHDNFVVADGGYASGVTLNDGGATIVGSAIVSAMVINSQGNYAAYIDGGTIYDTIINSGGATAEYSDTGDTTHRGGQAYRTLVRNGAFDEVISGATYSETVLSGGQQLLVNAAAVASHTVLSGGLLQAGAGRTVHTVISTGGLESLDGNAVASGSEVMRGGVQSVGSGATASGTLVSGGKQTVSGTEFSTQVFSGGTDNIAAGGVGLGTVVSNGGLQTVSALGVASGTRILAGGSVEVLSGGMASGTLVAQKGTQTIERGGFASGVQISGGLQKVSGSATATSVTARGEERVLSGGVTSGASISNHGLETVTLGGLAESTQYNSGGSGSILGSSFGAVVTSGGVLFVSSGGVADSTMLNAGGSSYVTGVTHSTTVLSNGAETVAARGSAVGTVLSAGGREKVTSGGVASATQILAGGAETISAGGTATQDFVASGGLLTVSKGGQIQNTTLASGGVVDIDSLRYAGTTAAKINGDTLTVTQQGKSFTITLEGDYSAYHATFSADRDGSTLVTLDDGAEVCFLPGTMISQPGGETAVEDLRIGDEVLTFANGVAHARPVIWAGHRRTSVRAGLPDDEAGYPVRILKGAVADNVPHTDLLVTPEHCLFFDGRFIPARMLVNGSSVFYDRNILTYAYYHIETEEHAVIMANGMLTESYLDTGNRRNFGQSGPLARIGGAVRTWVEDAAVPLAVDRATVEPVFHALAARATQQGLTNAPPEQQSTTDADLHVLTETGRIIRPMRVVKDHVLFLLPPDVACVRLVSRTFRPCDVQGPYVDDRRRMGVAVGAVTIQDGATSARLPTLLEPHANTGWQAPEAGNPARWTCGNALLALGQRTPGMGGVLRVQVLASGVYPLEKEMEPLPGSAGMQA